MDSRFNPAKWKKRNYELLTQQTKAQQAAKEKFKQKPQQVKTMDERIEAVAKAARKKRTKLTNEMFQLMDKNAFIEIAWNVYANNIYNKVASVRHHPIYRKVPGALFS